MRYLKAVGIGIFAFLFLNGIRAISGNEGTSTSNDNRVVFIKAEEDTDNLKAQLERMRTMASIREVLEVRFESASLSEKRELAETIYDACTLYDLNVELVLAVIQTESDFDVTAVSHKGALGLMQVMPRTGLAMSREMAIAGYDTHQLFDFRTNVMLGCYYLKKLIDRYGSLDHALLAYNQGPTKFDMALASNQMLSPQYASTVKGHMLEIAKLHFSDK